MADLPATRISLLARLRNRDDAASWQEFVGIYGPVVYGYGRKHGLQDSDAQDLTQVVLEAVVAAMARRGYDRALGSFRGWLFTLAHHKLYDLRARLRRQPPGTGDSDVRNLLEARPASDADQALWEQEYEKRLFDWAAGRARADFQEATWRAFWLTAVEGRAGDAVAGALGMTVAAVYMAKSRVMARLRALVAELEGDDPR
jgi:RNA polymerase sigma factor (sigma-70 family)